MPQQSTPTLTKNERVEVPLISPQANQSGSRDHLCDPFPGLHLPHRLQPLNIASARKAIEDWQSNLPQPNRLQGFVADADGLALSLGNLSLKNQSLNLDLELQGVAQIDWRPSLSPGQIPLSATFHLLRESKAIASAQLQENEATVGTHFDGLALLGKVSKTDWQLLGAIDLGQHRNHEFGGAFLFTDQQKNLRLSLTPSDPLDSLAPTLHCEFHQDRLSPNGVIATSMHLGDNALRVAYDLGREQVYLQCGCRILGIKTPLGEMSGVFNYDSKNSCPVAAWEWRNSKLEEPSGLSVFPLLGNVKITFSPGGDGKGQLQIWGQHEY